jgi:hypothetical protein
MYNVQVSERLSEMLTKAGCTGNVVAWPAGPSNDLHSKVQVDIHHDGDTCPIHEGR